MISAVFPRLRRWLSVLLMLSVALTCQLLLGACRPTEFKTEAAQVSQLVLTTLTDPKTFNAALNQEFPNIFLFAYEGLTRESSPMRTSYLTSRFPRISKIRSKLVRVGRFQRFVSSITAVLNLCCQSLSPRCSEPRQNQMV